MMHSRLIQVQRSARQDRYLLFELGKIRLLLKAHVFFEHSNPRPRVIQVAAWPRRKHSWICRGFPRIIYAFAFLITQAESTGIPSSPFRIEREIMGRWIGPEGRNTIAQHTPRGYPCSTGEADKQRLLYPGQSNPGHQNVHPSYPSNVPMRNTELIWVCDPALGVIHTQGCAHKQDRTRMYRYRHERDEARAKAARQEEELERLRAQLIEMQDAVVAMQQAYEDQLSSLVTSEVTSDESDVDMDIPPTVEPDPVLVIVGEAEQVDGSGLLVAPSVQVPPPRIVIDLTQTSSEEHIAESSSDAQSDRDSGYPTSESSDSIIILDGPPDPIPSTSYSLQEIEEFVTIARDSKRSGHKEALATIESFYAKAKATPRRLRNSTQTYILLKWKSLAKPAIQLDTSSLPAKPCPTLVVPSFSLRRPDLLAQLPPSPSLANVPEIIVDASFTGIGFMCRHVDKLS
ncbi:hypothetical protein BKA70DRAFT_1404872 [Coprinopsis sp. MPI-PUGE-AT-0042]|nr:hypothetical protein BKA70DRAFT_1404872 [Coprinopsis sp. MPI-PUGE-AT-0042]